MKKLTKDWVKHLEFHELIAMLQPNSQRKIPLVFTSGSADCIAKEHLHTFKNCFDMTEKENEFNFVMLPDTFDFDYISDDDKLSENFASQYLNRLRIISYIPDSVLKNVKDKRLLALGYATKQAKQDILGYLQELNVQAFDLLVKCSDECAQTVYC